MTSTQFGFAVGFAIAVVWAMTSFLIAIAALVAGIIGYLAVRAVQTNPQTSDVLERLLPRRQ